MTGVGKEFVGRSTLNFIVTGSSGVPTS